MRAAAPLILLVGWAAAVPRQASAVQTAEPDPPWWGHPEWQALSGPEREAFLLGFVNGAAWIEAGGAGSAGSAEREAIRLRREGRLSFGLAPNVYLARLADYYFWENHRSHRLPRALAEIRLALEGGREAGPVRGRGIARPTPRGAVPEPREAAGGEPAAAPAPSAVGDGPAAADPLATGGSSFLAWPQGARRAFAAGLSLGAATARALEAPGVLEERLDELRKAGRLPLSGEPGACARALAERYSERGAADAPVLRVLASLRPRC